MEEKTSIILKVFKSYKKEILDQYSLEKGDWCEEFREKVWNSLMIRFFGAKSSTPVEKILDEFIYGDFLGERVSEFMEVLGSVSELNPEK